MELKKKTINWKVSVFHLMKSIKSMKYLHVRNGLNHMFYYIILLKLIFRSNLCLIDLSYNILNDLQKTIQSLKNLNKLRILFLHGNPISV